MSTERLQSGGDGQEKLFRLERAFLLKRIPGADVDVFDSDIHLRCVWKLLNVNSKTHVLRCAAPCRVATEEQEPLFSPTDVLAWKGLKSVWETFIDQRLRSAMGTVSIFRDGITSPSLVPAHRKWRIIPPILPLEGVERTRACFP